MSNAINSHGTVLKRNGTAVAEVRDITPPPLQRNTFDVSTQNDNDDAYIVGRRRRGEMSWNINWLPSGEVTHGAASGLLNAWASGTKDLYQLTYPDGSYWIFSGYLVNLAPAVPEDGGLSADVTVRPVGAHIFGGGS
jgi:hypothetical protein